MPAVTVTPTKGGALITRAAAAEVGIPHYTVKRNWRRDLTDEIRREGFDYLIPAPGETDETVQPFPTDEEISLIHMVTRPNGDASLVVGTPNTLYRFNIDQRGYVDGVDGQPYTHPHNDPPIQPYDLIGARWEIIGDDFEDSPPARRWETADVNGTSAFNNANDLPVAFRHEWAYTEPINELREQGVVSVGTISEFDGVMMTGDIWEMREEDIPKILGVKSSDPVTVRQDGTTEYPVIPFEPFKQDPDPYSLFTAVDFFTPEMEGQTIAWEDGQVRKIQTVVHPTHARTDTPLPHAPGIVYFDNPDAFLSRAELEAKGYVFERRQYRVIWSGLDDPTDFSGRVTAEATAGSTLLRLKNTTRTFHTFDEVIVDGAGPNGAALVTTPSGDPVTITAAGPGFVTLNTEALTSVEEGGLMPADSAGSISGFEDLQDDGSAILKMLPLQNRLVIYKDTNIFLAVFTGVFERPYQFERVIVPHGRSLHYRNTLCSIKNQIHTYAGRTRFYEFNLSTRVPEVIAASDLIENTFFDFALIENTERIYCTDNQVTQEIWIICRENIDHPVIAYDYVYKTFSTMDWFPSAAETQRELKFPRQAESGICFYMGTTAGVMLIYGLTSHPLEMWDNKSAIYYRREGRPFSLEAEGYESRLRGGLMDFGDPYNEKHWRSYVVQFSSQSNDNPNITGYFYRARNQAEPGPALIGFTEISDSDNHGLVPIHSIAHLFQDELIAAGQNNPMRIHQRTFDVTRLTSSSFHKRP